MDAVNEKLVGGFVLGKAFITADASGINFVGLWLLIVLEQAKEFASFIVLFHELVTFDFHLVDVGNFLFVEFKVADEVWLEFWQKAFLGDIAILLSANEDLPCLGSDFTASSLTGRPFAIVV